MMLDQGDLRLYLKGQMKWATTETIEAIYDLLGTCEPPLGEMVMKAGFSLYERSPRVAIEYFLASRKVSRLIRMTELDRWAAIGAELAGWDHDIAVAYFRSSFLIAKLSGMAGIEGFAELSRQLAGYSWRVAAEYFNAAPKLLEQIPLAQLGNWVTQGKEISKENEEKALAYFSLLSSAADEKLKELRGGLSLTEIDRTLRLYIQGLSGRQVAIREATGLDELLANFILPTEPAIYLPRHVSLFPDNRDNFQVFRIRAAHEAAHFEFGTYDFDMAKIPETVGLLARKYGQDDKVELASDMVRFLVLFPNIDVALELFHLIEDGRINANLKRSYPGLRRYMGLLSSRNGVEGPTSEEGSHTGEAFDLLEELLSTGKASRPIPTALKTVEEAYRMFLERIRIPDSPVETSAELAARIYLLFDDYSQKFAQGRTRPAKASHTKKSLIVLSETAKKEQAFEEKDKEREYSDEPGEGPETEPVEDPRQKTYSYDEWDDSIKGYRTAWCTLREYLCPLGTGDFVKETLANYAPLISSIKRQFEILRPDLKKMKRQEDGEDIDLEAAVEFFIDKRMGITPSDKLYIQRRKKLRSLSVALLLDMSGSTRKEIQASGKKIIDLEKESMILFMEALDVLADEYAIYGFSSRGREHVYFYGIKDFDDKYTDVTRRRIGGLAPVANTRLGTAIRHASMKLGERDRQVKLLILLTDSKPSDYDYRERYAHEDTKIALLETRSRNINTFCITLDKEGKDLLPDLYAHNNYIVIDDINSLPEKLPNIYKNLTT